VSRYPDVRVVAMPAAVRITRNAIPATMAHLSRKGIRYPAAMTVPVSHDIIKVIIEILVMGILPSPLSQPGHSIPS